jgi:hypothetical protein
MSLRKFKGYWTIFSKQQPVLSFSSFERAWTALYELRA